jgi:3-deoxy-7-phosphoheptulonate synthase
LTLPTTDAQDDSAQRAVCPRLHQPQWPDPAALSAAVGWLAEQPPLVGAAECERLRAALAAVAQGKAFLVQGGACAETFADAAPDRVNNLLGVLRRLASVLSSALDVPAVLVGRMAGQYAKPRSEPTEVRDGIRLPAYFGDAVNDQRFEEGARTPDPTRMIDAYRASARVLAQMRWYVRAGGPAEVFASHEALLLDYETALCRRAPGLARSYGSSGHLLWIGDRTRAVDGAHVELLRHLANPLAVKLGPGADPDEVLALADRLDPDNEPGRLTLVVRMGARWISELLPPIISRVQAAGRTVAWVCDPMHGNTWRTANGRKTRLLADISDDVRQFFDVHHALGTWPGGLHLEVADRPVTECLGGREQVGLADLESRYESACDPRLSPGQALDLVTQVATAYAHRDRYTPAGGLGTSSGLRGALARLRRDRIADADGLFLPPDLLDADPADV